MSAELLAANGDTGPNVSGNPKAALTQPAGINGLARLQQRDDILARAADDVLDDRPLLFEIDV